MSVQACADMVAKGDPDRFATAMAAPVGARKVLFPIYAFNLEVARAPIVAREPLIARMRLQWWREVLEEIRSGGPVRRHEVATPLGDVLVAEAAQVLLRVVDAREWDIDGHPFEDEAALLSYLDATAGQVAWGCALSLGAKAELEPIVKKVGHSTGLAAWFRAVPALRSAGRAPLPDARPGEVQSMARKALEGLAVARASRCGVPKDVAPALFPAALAAPVLRRVAVSPERVAEGTLAPSELRRRGILLRLAFLGRW